MFYLCACIDRALLVRNLGGGAEAETLAAGAIGALVEAAATTAPSGKQNSFAAHGRAHYVLAERGDAQPRTLAGAFARPIEAQDLMDASIAAPCNFRQEIDHAYGLESLSDKVMHVGVTGTLADVVAFAQG